MVKMLFAIRRLFHLSVEEFHRYWRENHGRLAQKKLPALRVKRYVQTHSIEALQAAFATPEGMQAPEVLLEDEKRFIDLPRSSMWFAEEELVIG